MNAPHLIPDAVILDAWRIAAEPERTTEAMVLAFARTIESLAHSRCAAFYSSQDQPALFDEEDKYGGSA